VILAVAFLLILPSLAPAQLKTRLREDTLSAFNRYVAAAEETIRQRWQQQRSFLWIRERQDYGDKVGKGEIIIEKGALDKKIEIPDGMVHHWIAAVLVTKGDLKRAVTLLQDFDRHQEIYPEITSSRLIERKDDTLRGYWRLRKKKVITVVLDTEQTVRYHSAGPSRAYSEGAFTSIREVEDAGTTKERILPPDEGHGFMWRLNAYWRIEAAPEGLYLECESITLSRNIPFGLSFIIRPMVESLPRESLLGSLEATRTALK
jgi:hypothetical protein